MPDEFFQQSIAVNNFEIKTSTNYISSRLFTSKVHQFENLPEQKNATEEEQEAFHSKTYDFSIPDNSRYLLRFSFDEIFINQIFVF
ncbi:hypothetical protein RhiirA1_455168 [Rhizophagus irregularis]|uniref:Uncharacterized protein n=1 Tax=Rhizophagus irregularis TaxID=588596 RepID=A0A2N0S3N6_9GLOM|nr:hypothetical protein RhiirA1_455168 [Rhizophagus irregularis]